jgi:hypothetical protein
MYTSALDRAGHGVGEFDGGRRGTPSRSASPAVRF